MKYHALIFDIAMNIMTLVRGGYSIGYWFGEQAEKGTPLTFRELFTWIDYSELRLHYHQLTAVDEHHFSDIYTDLMRECEKTGDYGIVYDSSNCPLGKRFKPILDLII